MPVPPGATTHCCSRIVSGGKPCAYTVDELRLANGCLCYDCCYTPVLIGVTPYGLPDTAIRCFVIRP